MINNTNDWRNQPDRPDTNGYKSNEHYHEMFFVLQNPLSFFFFFISLDEVLLLLFPFGIKWEWWEWGTFWNSLCKGRKTGKELVWILFDGGTKRERELEKQRRREKRRVERMTDAVITSLIIEHFMMPILSLSSSILRVGKDLFFQSRDREGSIHWGNQRNGRVVGIIPSGSCFRWGSLIWS